MNFVTTVESLMIHNDMTRMKLNRTETIRRHAKVESVTSLYSVVSEHEQVHMKYTVWIKQFSEPLKMRL